MRKHWLAGWLVLLMSVQSATAQVDKPAAEVPAKNASEKPQDEAGVEKWYGLLDLKVIKLRLEIRLRQQADGAYTGGMVSLDQSETEVPFDTITYDREQMSWKIDKLQASYEGRLDKDQKSIKGTFKQGFTEAALELKKVDAVPERKQIQAWQGNLVAGPQTFDFQFRIYEDTDGKTAVYLDSFTEKIGDIDCEMTHDGNQVTISVPITSARLVGTLNETKDTLEGKWLQSGKEFPITLKVIPIESTRKINATPLKCPQTPKPPFDYDSEDLKIKNEKGGSVLAGTLTSPKGPGPFPLVITISGSGAQDRDETIFGHKPFWVIADHLAKNGIAVFRFDDRGVAKSKGDYLNSTSEDFASDVMAIVNELKQHPKVDPGKILLAGHSEGGIIAPMVASQTKDVAGIIMLAGTGVSGKEISLNQSRKIASGSGMAPAIVDMQEQILIKMYNRLEEGGEFDDEFTEKLAAEMKELLPEEIRGGNFVEKILETAKAQLSSPWFKYFAIHDPAPVLEQVHCPVILIIGEKDTQVDPDLNVPPIEAALKKGGNQDVEIDRMPDLNHLFQKCETGLPGEYINIEQTISPDVLELITNWISKRFLSDEP